jgi:hypothetical protein
MRMKRKQFCYYHLQLHTDWVLPGLSLYQPPALDNPHGIAIALSHLMIAQSKRTISPVEAKHMLYTIQLAQQNLRLIEQMKADEPADSPDPETDFTPGMRHSLHMEEEPIVIEDGHPRPSESEDLVMVNEGDAQTTIPVEELVKVSEGACPSRTTPSALIEPPDAPGNSHSASPLRRPHPLSGQIGLRPWHNRFFAGENPEWIPIADDEWKTIKLQHDDYDNITPEELWNLRRVHIYARLIKHGGSANLEQMMRAITESELEERDLRREVGDYLRQEEARTKALQRRDQRQM